MMLRSTFFAQNYAGIMICQNLLIKHIEAHVKTNFDLACMVQLPEQSGVRTAATLQKKRSKWLRFVASFKKYNVMPF